MEIGQRLKLAREVKGATINLASQATRIHPRHLAAMESGDFDSIPSKPQLKGFLRAYAQYLGLDANQLLAELDSGLPDIKPPAPPREDVGPAINEANAVFEEIGAILASQRDALNLSLEEAADHTLIPSHYLGYMESGSFDKFPSPAQARGMLGSYARFLQADEQLLLLRYADALQLRLAGRKIGTPPLTEKAKPASTSPLFQWLKTHLSRELVLIILTSISLVVVMIVILAQVLNTRLSIQPMPTAPPLANALLPSATPNPSPSPELELSPTPELPASNNDPETVATATIPAGGQAPVQLFIVVRQRSYLKVIVDGTIAFEGRVSPGQSLPFSGQEVIEVLTGNGAGIEVYLNQQNLGALGIFGEVVNRLFTATGPVTPTASITPTNNPSTPTP